MSSSSVDLVDDLEFARAMDEALAGLLPVATLLESAASDTALSPGLQRRLLDLDYAAISVPEAQGGLGLPWAQVVRLAAVGGRHLLPSMIRGEGALLAPALAELAAGGGLPEAGEDLDGVMSGRRRGGAAVFRADADSAVAYLPGDAEIVACIDGDSVVIASTTAGHVSLEPLNGVDAGQGATIVNRGPAWGDAPVVSGSAAHTLQDRWTLVLIGEAFGAAQRCLELACAYASDREQFGTPIVAFQAVSHQLAKMAVELEAAEAGIGRLVQFLSHGNRNAELALALRCYVPAAARRICEGSIQVHGGAGFTWELGLHLYYRRVLAIQQDLGGGSRSVGAAGRDYLDRIAGTRYD